MELISIIFNFILGSGLLGMLIFYRSKQRKEIAEAQTAELSVKRDEMEIEHQSITFLQTQLADAYSEIDKMQEIINTKRDQIIDLIRKTKDLEIALIDYQTTRRRLIPKICCDSLCANRVLPTDEKLNENNY